MSRKAVPSHHHSRDTIGQFLAPENGYRGSLERKGIQPKDHMRENVKEMRLAQMRVKAKKDEDSRPVKPLYKLAQFKDVESRLYDEPVVQVDHSSRRASFDRQEFLTRGQSERRREDLARESRAIRNELEVKMEEERMMREKPLTPRKPSVPRANELAHLAGPSDADFINRNRVEAITKAPRGKRDNDDDRPSKHEDFGRVPQYLEDRKARWAEEQEEIRRRMPDPDCPRGMRVMPDSERMQTLEVLQQSREEALQQLRKMPFVIETPSMRKKQEFLEGKLREIDNALSIFSKPKVYVADGR